MATLVSLLYTYISTELCTAAEPLESARCVDVLGPLSKLPETHDGHAMGRKAEAMQVNLKPLIKDVRRHQPSREEVLALVHLPIHKAALKLGMKATAFKKLCRNHKIHRWPHRQYQSLNSLSCQLQAQGSNLVDTLESGKAAILYYGQTPNYVRLQSYRKLRQHSYRLKYPEATSTCTSS